ncbi:MAG: phosphopantetheine-binding protein [Oscillospiraceae bacterium]|jgi:acyl carrier protein|nr:phosphopantetheine-binding protein [Oscillospiraceae bacterium]
MIYEKVATFISEQFNIDEDDINEDMTFEEIGADEFDIAELASAIEGEFDIELGEDEVSDLKDVAGLVKLVKTAVELSH